MTEQQPNPNKALTPDNAIRKTLDKPVPGIIINGVYMSLNQESVSEDVVEKIVKHLS